MQWDWLNVSLLGVGSVQLTPKAILLSCTVLLTGLWVARLMRGLLLLRLVSVLGMDKSSAFTLATQDGG